MTECFKINPNFKYDCEYINKDGKNTKFYDAQYS